MGLSVFKNSFSKSLGVHLLLLLMIAFISIHDSEKPSENQPISVSMIDAKKDLKDRYNSQKTSIFIKSKNAKSVSVSDLGVKIDANQWTSHVLAEAAVNKEYTDDLRGDETSLLSSREFVYESYIRRFHDQLLHAWEPILMKEAERLMNSGLLGAPKNGFVTSTIVTINAKGEIVKVQILQKSGVFEFDSAALTALNEAGPYPNPPRGLIDENGTAQLPWNFVFRD